MAPSKNSLSNEPIPKSLARVLNAAKTREDWRNKRKLEEDGDQKPRKKKRKVEDGAQGKRKGAQSATKLAIKPGESMQHFNRCVSTAFRVTGNQI